MQQRQRCFGCERDSSRIYGRDMQSKAASCALPLDSEHGDTMQCRGSRCRGSITPFDDHASLSCIVLDHFELDVALASLPGLSGGEGVRRKTGVEPITVRSEIDDAIAAGINSCITHTALGVGKCTVVRPTILPPVSLLLVKLDMLVDPFRLLL